MTGRPKDELLTAGGIAGWCLVAGLVDVLEQKGLLGGDDAVRVVLGALRQLDEIKGIGEHEALAKARILLASELADRQAKLETSNRPDLSKGRSG